MDSCSARRPRRSTRGRNRRACFSSASAWVIRLSGDPSEVELGEATLSFEWTALCIASSAHRQLKEVRMVMRDMLIGVGIGATLAYMADPRAGRRRRALARDQFVRATRKTRDALDATARDLANRTSGIVASARGRWTDFRVDDRRLTQRVRAVLGRTSSHPRAIDVYVSDGVVTLTGPILADEVTGLVEAVCDVRGVQTVDNNLTVYSS